MFLIVQESSFLERYRTSSDLETLAAQSISGTNPALTSDPLMTQEQRFYTTKPTMRIAEIGAGSTVFVQYWLPHLKQATIFVNDVDPILVQHMADEIEYHNALRNKGHELFAVLGSNYSTGLEGQALDIMLIRNAFHHFSAPDAMLKSIKRSMKASGTLYLKEAFKESCTENCCPDLGHREEILKIISQNGFQLIRTQVIHEGSTSWYLLAFEMIPG